MENTKFIQTTDEVLMIRPCSFGFNSETAANNTFQKRGYEEDAQETALKEFDKYVELLQINGVKVNVVSDTPMPHTPDSIFPNNWFSTHSNGTLVLYPMFAKNRREERKTGVMDYMIENFDIHEICDLTAYEDKGLFLEGTGSMVIDRENGIVFACKSPRTDETVLKEFCKVFGWEYCMFNANDDRGNAIYHTNVMMSIGSRFSVVCLDSIKDIFQKKNFMEKMKYCKKEIVEISFDQMNHFAGNMIELHSSENDKNIKGQPLLIMSETAFNVLSLNQKDVLESYYKILSPNLKFIEANGGGSARCMIAEIFIK